MSTLTPILFRLPGELVEQLDAWATAREMSRNRALVMLVGVALDQDAALLERLSAEFPDVEERLAQAAETKVKDRMRELLEPILA